RQTERDNLRHFELAGRRIRFDAFELTNTAVLGAAINRTPPLKSSGPEVLAAWRTGRMIIRTGHEVSPSLRTQSISVTSSHAGQFRDWPQKAPTCTPGCGLRTGRSEFLTHPTDFPTGWISVCYFATALRIRAAKRGTRCVVTSPVVPPRDRADEY